MTKKLDLPEKVAFINDYENMKSVSAMSRKYGVTTPTIRKWLHIFKVKKYTHYETIEYIRNRKKNTISMIECNNESFEERLTKSSIGQNEINEFINSLGYNTILNDRSVIKPLEIDITIPDMKIGIEYCGVYFHSQTFGNKPPSYHKNKMDAARKEGYHLITIFETDWFNKKEIVKSILRHKLGKTENIVPARKTEVRKLNYSDIKIFENENHIQGTRPAKEYYGLFLNDSLVMSLSIGKPRYNKNYENEIVRMTVAKNMHIQGGVSKLLKYAGVKKCITYVDLRFGTGNSYSKSGMKFIGTSRPGYQYFHKSDSNTLYSRVKFQKFKIKDVDESKSEYENMISKGYDRIWDCGNAIYEIS